MKKKTERFLCPYCQKKVAIDKNGRIAIHRASFENSTCPNSNKLVPKVMNKFSI